MKLKLIFTITMGVFAGQLFAAAPVVDAQDARAKQQARSNQQNQLIAELVLQINQLQQEVRQLRGQLEEQDYRMNQLAKQQRDLYLDLDKRIQAGVTAQPENGEDTANGGDLASAGSDVQDAYNKAFTQYKDKEYAFAKSSFKTFIETYPDEALASNAHFWLGQLHLKDKEYEQAESRFKAVYEGFPGANKSDVAVLKLGQLEEARGNKAAAKGYYQRVVTEFPDSTAGKLAKAKLKAL